MHAKTIGAILICSSLCLCLNACGPNTDQPEHHVSASASSSFEENANSQSVENDEKSDDAEKIDQSKLYDVGDFQVYVPDNWMAYPQVDIFQDADENGNRPYSTSSFGLIKDGDEVSDAAVNPTILIYLNSGSIHEDVDLENSWFQDVEELDYSIPGLDQYKIYNAKSQPVMEDTVPLSYQLVYIQLEDDQYCQVIIQKSDDISVESDDVQNILRSIQITK